MFNRCLYVSTEYQVVINLHHEGVVISGRETKGGSCAVWNSSFLFDLPPGEVSQLRVTLEFVIMQVKKKNGFLLDGNIPKRSSCAKTCDCSSSATESGPLQRQSSGSGQDRHWGCRCWTGSLEGRVQPAGGAGALAHCASRASVDTNCAKQTKKKQMTMALF